MKKILILIFTLFLVSCGFAETNIPIKRSYFVTNASAIPHNTDYAIKFESYETYQTALDTEFQIPTNRRIYDEEFFEESDLIVVIYRAGTSLSQNMFQLLRVYESQHIIHVSIRLKYPSGEMTTAIGIHTYLITIDKMDNMPVHMEIITN